MTSNFSFSDFGWGSAAGPAAAVLGQVDAALAAGGDPVRSLFAADLTALGALRQAAAGGTTTWISGTDDTTGLPVRYVAVGDTFLILGIVPGETTGPALTAGAAQPQPVGFLYLVLSAGGAEPVVTQLLSATASYQGDPVPDFAAGDGLKDLIGGLVDKATDFVGKIFELAWESGEAADLGAAAASTADATDAAAAATSGPTVITGPGGMKIEADVELTTGEAVSLGLSIVAYLASLILQVLAKQMTGYVRVYNATGDELDVGLAWLHPDAAYAGPMATEFVTLPRIGTVWTPPWVIGEQAVSYAGWTVGNTDSLSRIGYVLRIAATGAFPGADVMVDIPNTGANSLAIGIGAGEDFAGFWSSNSGADTGLVAAASADGCPYRIRMATNQTSGRSPAPTDGAEGYSFEHVIVVEPAS